MLWTRQLNLSREGVSFHSLLFLSVCWNHTSESKGPWAGLSSRDFFIRQYLYPVTFLLETKPIDSSEFLSGEGTKQSSIAVCDALSTPCTERFSSTLCRPTESVWQFSNCFVLKIYPVQRSFRTGLLLAVGSLMYWFWVLGGDGILLLLAGI